MDKSIQFGSLQRPIINQSPVSSRMQNFNLYLTKIYKLNTLIPKQSFPIRLKHKSQADPINQICREVVSKSNKTMVKQLQKDHITLKNCIHILDLPKSPWGRHDSYNDKNDFRIKHFSTPDNLCSKQTKTFYKKQGIMKRCIKRLSQTNKKRLERVIRTHSFESNSGRFYCSKDVEAEDIYVNDLEKTNNVEKRYKDATNKINELLEKVNWKPKVARNSEEITRRLYTPSPTLKKANLIAEKYKELWNN
jgi:hypothetical protein